MMSAAGKPDADSFLSQFNPSLPFLIMNAIISLRILALRAEGLSLPEAFDAVLGAGAFEKMAGELYDALKEKAE